jgi:ammonia channel protein AmtB
VAVCAGCGSLAPWAAFVTGSLGGLSFLCGRSIVDKLKGITIYLILSYSLNSCNIVYITLIVDDMLDSFALHYSAGLVGLVTAPFLVPNGLLFKPDVASSKVRVEHNYIHPASSRQQSIKD